MRARKAPAVRRAGCSAPARGDRLPARTVLSTVPAAAQGPLRSLFPMTPSLPSHAPTGKSGSVTSGARLHERLPTTLPALNVPANSQASTLLHELLPTVLEPLMPENWQAV